MERGVDLVERGGGLGGERADKAWRGFSLHWRVVLHLQACVGRRKQVKCDLGVAWILMRSDSEVYFLVVLPQKVLSMALRVEIPNTQTLEWSYLS